MLLTRGLAAASLLAAAAVAYQRLAGGSVAQIGSPPPQSYVSSYEILEDLPHDPRAFVQGLAFDASGTLYESDGIYRRSAVRAIDIATGGSTITTRNRDDIFGEGVAVLGETLIQLSWQNKLLFEYSLPGLALQRTLPLHIGAEGWGLATDGERLYLTDSGDSLFTLEPGSYTLLRKAVIRDPMLGDGATHKPIHGVNELEWVHGELWGNVYPMYQGKHSECVVRINATTAEVIGWVDLRGLQARQRPEVTRSPMNYVLNGIAYHAPTDRMYVTGKNWDRMYRIRLTAQPELGPEHVASVCNLG